MANHGNIGRPFRLALTPVIVTASKESRRAKIVCLFLSSAIFNSFSNILYLGPTRTDSGNVLMLKLILVDFEHNKWLPLSCGQARTERESKTARRMGRVKERRGGFVDGFLSFPPPLSFFRADKTENAVSRSLFARPKPNGNAW